MTDGAATTYPVSVKGVVNYDGKFVLLKNERDEWELPGGKLDCGEDVADCIVREIKEELNLDTEVKRALNNWVYHVNNVDVVVVTYSMRPIHEGKIRASHEHKAFALFGLDEIPNLNMPDGYKEAIRLASQIMDDSG